MCHKDSLSLGEVCDLVATIAGRKPHIATIHRWVHRGVSGRRLRARRVGGRWIVSRVALEDFLNAERIDPDPHAAETHASSQAKLAIGSVLGRPFGRKKARDHRSRS
jgi:hypothetical protein